MFTLMLILFVCLCNIVKSGFDTKQITAQQIHIAIGDRVNERRVTWVTFKEPENESRVKYGFKKDNLNFTTIAKN
ncbi:hypothetical protein B4U80_14438, partial [Leptotrombidium deliense]